MQLEFNVQENDLQQFYAFHYWYSPDRKTFRLKRRLYQGGLMVFFLIFFLWIGERQVTKGLLISGAVMAIVLFWIGVVLAKYSLLRHVDRSLKKSFKEGKNEDLIGRRTMEFTDDTIVARSPLSESTVKTQVIEKFREDSNSYYIYISAIQAYVIPKRELKTQDKVALESWITKHQ
jgi:hypothetical protein